MLKHLPTVLLSTLSTTTFLIAHQTTPAKALIVESNFEGDKIHSIIISNIKNPNSFIQLQHKNTFLEPNCPVCLSEFDGVETKAVILGCGHSVCEDCFSQLKEYGQGMILIF